MNNNFILMHGEEFESSHLTIVGHPLTFSNLSPPPYFGLFIWSYIIAAIFQTFITDHSAIRALMLVPFKKNFFLF